MAAASPPVRAHLTRAPRVTSARPVSVILRPRAEAATALTTTSSSAVARPPATVMPGRSVIRRSAPAHAFVPARPASKRSLLVPVSITSNLNGHGFGRTIAVAEHRVVPAGQCGTPGTGECLGSATLRPARNQPSSRPCPRSRKMPFAGCSAAGQRSPESRFRIGEERHPHTRPSTARTPIAGSVTSPPHKARTISLTQ